MTETEKSIVVLPFEDMSPGKDNAYFSEGLTVEIITELSHVRGLLVISRSSAMTFKGTRKTIRDGRRVQSRGYEAQADGRAQVFAA
jgi:TolB-like protein